MSIYSGFPTRQHEASYNRLLTRLLVTLQAHVVELVRLTAPMSFQWAQKYRKQVGKLKEYEEHKYLEPKFSQFLTPIMEIVLKAKTEEESQDGSHGVTIQTEIAQLGVPYLHGPTPKAQLLPVTNNLLFTKELTAPPQRNIRTNSIVTSSKDPNFTERSESSNSIKGIDKKVGVAQQRYVSKEHQTKISSSYEQRRPKASSQSLNIQKDYKLSYQKPPSTAGVNVAGQIARYLAGTSSGNSARLSQHQSSQVNDVGQNRYAATNQKRNKTQTNSNQPQKLSKPMAQLEKQFPTNWQSNSLADRASIKRSSVLSQHSSALKTEPSQPLQQQEFIPPISRNDITAFRHLPRSQILPRAYPRHINRLKPNAVWAGQ